MPENKKIIYILGPTGSGKTHLTKTLLGTEVNHCIVNCDSLQVYQGLDIGTAKPSKQEQQQVPHFLFDHVAIGENYTAGLYQRQARELIQTQDWQNYIFVGGSGFYFQAFEKGMFKASPTSKDLATKLTKQMEVEGSLVLYEKLKTLDPEYAEKISKHDSYRIMRSLAIIETQGRSMTQVQQDFRRKKSTLPYPVIKIGLFFEREVLRKKITERTEVMLAQGLVEEVVGLLKVAPAHWPPLSSIGYKEVKAYLNGRISDKKNLVALIVQNSMRLVKKQMTWFKRDQGIHWVDCTKSYDEACERLKSSVY